MATSFSLADGGTIGIGGAKWTFDDTNDDISTTAKIGIGTTAPDDLLHVETSNSGNTNTILVKNSSDTSSSSASFEVRTAGSSAGDPFIQFDINGIGGWTIGMDNSDYDKLKIDRGAPPTVGGGTKFTIDTSGNVGIGTTTPTLNCEIVSSTSNNYSQGHGNLLIKSNLGTNDYIYEGQHKAQLRIQSYSNNKTLELGVAANGRGFIQANETNVGYQDLYLSCIGSKVGIMYNTSSSLSYTLQINGSCYAGSGFTSSDDRIKYNEVDIDTATALNVITQLTPQKYEKIITFSSNTSGNWIPTDADWPSVKDNYEYDEEIGLIAQDVKTIPELAFCVNGDEVDSDGNQTPLQLNYNNILVYHIAATKELTTQLNAEKAKTATLETQIADLLTRVTALENP